MQNSQFIVQLHHILAIIVILSGGLWAFIRFYMSAFSTTLKTQWDSDIYNSNVTLKTSLKKDIEELKHVISHEASADSIKNKVRDYIEGETKLMQQDIRQIKEITIELKEILSSQQETLIALQLSLTELKPRLDNLENRVTRLENKKGD
jgi:ubiquinone biosynthesis protein UbiJ